MTALPFEVSVADLVGVHDFRDLPDWPIYRRLKSHNQWVAWVYEVVNDRTKPTKVPKSPITSFNASVSKPTNWGSYRAALSFCDRKNYDGIGFVLSESDGLCGIDLDSCRNAETGEIAPWAAEIIGLAESYAEISPSGEGIRIFCEGKPDKAIKNDEAGVEIYGLSRYLTLTGWHVLGTPKDIHPAPQTMERLIARVTQFKKADKPTSAPVMAGQPLPTPAGGGEFFRNVNTAALQMASLWVPSLFGSAARHQPGTGAYRISSKALGRKLEEDLSIAPNGIVDFGVHDMGDARDGKRTPIDLAIEFGGHADARSAAFWLCDCLGRTPASLGWGERDAIGTAIATTLLKNDDGTVVDADTGEVIEPKPSQATPIDRLSLANPDLWLKPQGLIAEMADWILATSRRPNRPLAVASAIAVMSAITGRHVYSPTACSLNLYMVCLAATSVGKGRPLSAIGEIVNAAGFGRLHTTAKAFSVSAIEAMIVDHPCCVATADEIGANLLARMSNKRSSTHESAMRGAFLELYSRSRGQTPFQTHQKAGAASVEVKSPSLSLFGASTPEAFYESLTAGSVKDGFLNRFLIVNAAPRAAVQSFPADFYRVPQTIIEGLQRIVPGSAGRGNVASAMDVFSPICDPDSHCLEWATPDLSQFFEVFEEEILALGDKHVEVQPIIGRIAEGTIRLASLHAISRGGRHAKVCREDIMWGASLAIASARQIAIGVEGYMAASEYEANLNIVRNVIREHSVIGRRELLRRVRSISARDREQIIAHLKEGGWIRDVKIQTAGRHAEGLQWID